MKEVADELEKACDAFEHVANTIEQIAVKESWIDGDELSPCIAVIRWRWLFDYTNWFS